MTKSKKDIKNLLVRVPNWIGDAVICLPALSSLAELYRGARITVLAKSRVAPVFESVPALTEIIIYDDKGRHKGMGGRLRLAAELRKKRFQMAVLFQNAFEAAFISFISGIPARVGYARDLRAPLLTRPVRLTPEIKTRHQVFYYLNIIEELGGKVPENPAPSIRLTGDEAAWAEGFISDNGLEGREIAGVSPGASYGPAKRWPPERFASVLSELSERDGAVPVIFGGDQDKETCTKVERALKTRRIDSVNLAGKLTLREFMALLARAGVFITNDSGPMHLASALGVPTVAVFGSTDAALTGPLGSNTRVVKSDIDCSPCFDRKCRYEHYECLTRIDAAVVVRAALELMAGCWD